MNRFGTIVVLSCSALLPLLGGCATIHTSADAGDLAKVDQLLEKGIAVDARDEFGRTPLMWATEDLEVVRHLAERGADIDARDANGETAHRVVLGAWHSHGSMVKVSVDDVELIPFPF